MLLWLEPGKGGRKERPAHQVFVNGLPEECPSCLVASHPYQAQSCSQARPDTHAHTDCAHRGCICMVHLQTIPPHRSWAETYSQTHSHTHPGSCAHTPAQNTHICIQSCTHRPCPHTCMYTHPLMYTQKGPVNRSKLCTQTLSTYIHSHMHT